MALSYCQCSVFQSFINSLITFIEHEFCGKYLAYVGTVDIPLHTHAWSYSIQWKTQELNRPREIQGPIGAPSREGQSLEEADIQVHLFRSGGDIWAEKMMWKQEGGLLAASGMTPAEGQKGDSWTSLSRPWKREGMR